MLMVIVLLGFALVAGLFVYLTVLDAGKWRRKLDHILLPIGFEPVASEAEKASLGKLLSIVNPAHRGERLVKHLYRRRSADGAYIIFVCDTYFGSASGKARGGNWLLVGLTSHALQLPRFSIHSAGNLSGAAAGMFGALSQLVEVPGLRRVETGDAELDQRLQVYAEPARSGIPIPTELLRQLGDCAGGASVDAQADTVVLRSVGTMADRVRQVLDPQKIQAQIQMAVQIYTAARA